MTSVQIYQVRSPTVTAGTNDAGLYGGCRGIFYTLDLAHLRLDKFNTQSNLLQSPADFQRIYVLTK